MRKFFLHPISILFSTQKTKKNRHNKLQNKFSLKKLGIKFLTHFISDRKKRKFFKKLCYNNYINFAFGKKKYAISGNNNRIIIVWNDREYVMPRFLKINGIAVKIKGNNNTIKIEFPIYGLTNNHFIIIGDNSIISIKKSQNIINNLTIQFHIGKNRAVLIDENFSVGGLFLCLEDDDSSICIGKDCMFSHDLFIRESDGHSIIDYSGNLKNKASKMVIGNHVWIGAWARLCKDVYIPDGCIIGMGSIVTKKFTKKNSIIAGNPAKVVKEDVKWVRETPNFYRKG